ncbi:hypothetical protein Sjap_018039 [Stephania japonica]|uniref:Uncharacterized protein n=1 Tax=Stephania japonica TaxID=461633 RepID=A0AAP0I795_9MAGN
MPWGRCPVQLVTASPTYVLGRWIFLHTVEMPPKQKVTASLAERFYFGDHILPCFETGIPLLKQRLHQLPDAKNISIAFPDDGAWKRESLFLKAIENKAPFEVLSLAGSIADALQI